MRRSGESHTEVMGERLKLYHGIFWQTELALPHVNSVLFVLGGLGGGKEMAEGVGCSILL